MDKRTAISFCRADALAISRFATLVQAMRSTSPTMHISTISALEKLFLIAEKPVAALSTCSVPLRNCSRAYGDQSFAAGNVVSYSRI